MACMWRTGGNWFSHFTMWLLETELRLLPGSKHLYLLSHLIAPSFILFQPYWALMFLNLMNPSQNVWTCCLHSLDHCWSLQSIPPTLCYYVTTLSFCPLGILFGSTYTPCIWPACLFDLRFLFLGVCLPGPSPCVTLYPPML